MSGSAPRAPGSGAARQPASAPSGLCRLPPLARASAVFLLVLAVLAALTPWLPLADPQAMDDTLRLEPPHWTGYPVLGTDAKGRDLLARVLWGARVSLTVGVVGTLVALLVGVPYGAFAGLRGGRTDRVMMRTADALESVPLVVCVLFLLSLLQEYRLGMAAVGIGRMQLFLVALGLLFWLPTARVARAEALRLRGRPYVLAGRAVGLGTAGLLRRHLLPNMAPALWVMLTLTVPRVVLMEAFLSFLGLGVEPPAVSWGLLAADGLAALNPLVDCWWLLVVPAAALSLTLLALNLLGDGLRATR